MDLLELVQFAMRVNLQTNIIFFKKKKQTPSISYKNYTSCNQRGAKMSEKGNFLKKL